MIHPPTHHKSGQHEGLIVHGGYADRESAPGRSRQIVNGAGYFDAVSSLWLPSHGRGNPWTGPGNAPQRIREGAPHAGYTYHAPEGSLQFHCRDATDTGNRALIRIDLPHKPGSFVSWKAKDCSDADWVPDADGNGGTFFDLWDGAHWHWRIGADRAKDTIKIHDLAVAPNQFEWTVRAAGGHHFAPAEDGLRFYKTSTGEHLGTMRHPFAWDANGSAEEPNIRCRYEFPAQDVVRITVNPDDRFNAVDWIEIDPIVELTGAGDLDDTSIEGAAAQATRNFGGSGYYRSAVTSHILTRVLDAALPIGNYTSVSHRLYGSGISGSFTIENFMLLDSAILWVKGTKSNGTEVGSSCHTMPQFQFAGIPKWPIGNGAFSSAEYEVTGGGSTVLVRNNTYQDIPVVAAHLQSIADGDRINNGWATAFTASSVVLTSITTRSANPPSVIIEYTEAAGGGYLAALLSGGYIQ